MGLIPVALVALRVACGPALLLAWAGGASGQVLAGILTLAFLSDVFDGIIARRLGVATESLRAADSLVDTFFYLCAAAALVLRAPHVVSAYAAGIGAVIALELARWILEYRKYGRLAAYHMWSAKAWGIALWLGFTEAFVTGRPGPLFLAAVVVGIVADLEGLAASLVLPTWHHDVPTIWHALNVRRSQ